MGNVDKQLPVCADTFFWEYMEKRGSRHKKNRDVAASTSIEFERGAEK